MSHIPRHVFASSAYGASRTHSRELGALASVLPHTLAARRDGPTLSNPQYNALTAYDR